MMCTKSRMRCARDVHILCLAIATHLLDHVARGLPALDHLEGVVQQFLGVVGVVVRDDLQVGLQEGAQLGPLGGRQRAGGGEGGGGYDGLGRMEVAVMTRVIEARAGGSVR